MYIVFSLGDNTFRVIMILGMCLNFIISAVVTSACDNGEERKIGYNYGDIIQMHLEMHNIPSNFSHYLYIGAVNTFTKDLEYPLDARKYQEIRRETILLDKAINYEKYRIQLFERRNTEEVMVVELKHNINSTAKNKVKHLVNFSIRWNPFCIEFKHQQVQILDKDSNLVYTGLVYEQSCDEDTLYFKRITHQLENGILWLSPQNPTNTSIKYRFTVQSFDDNSQLSCVVKNGNGMISYIPLLSKQLKVLNSPLSLKVLDPTFTFKDGAQYEFSCQPKDNSSDIIWILFGGYNTIKDEGIYRYNAVPFKLKFTLTRDKFDGAKLVCLQYSCMYSKPEPEKNPIECTRVVQNVVTFRSSETLAPPTNTPVTNTTSPVETNTKTETTSFVGPVVAAAVVCFIGGSVITVIAIAYIRWRSIRNNKRRLAARPREPTPSPMELTPPPDTTSEHYYSVPMEREPPPPRPPRPTQI